MKWQYLVEAPPASCGGSIGISKPVDHRKEVEEFLNRKGQDGWELVQISGPNIYPMNYAFTFKRPII